MEVNLKNVEVILKKTKITKSILNQSNSLSFKEIDKNNIIGWCFDGKSKIVVSYNNELNTIEKSIFLRSCSVIEITKDNLKPVLKELGHDPDDLYYSYEDDFFDKHELLGTYIVNVFSDLNNRLYYLDTYSEVEKFVKQIEEYKSKVESRGKFYL
ncbi:MULTISPECIES: hypothetical protein [Empedobacter]|uniref:hypothetical protein n=1 Tax=Empedobacter TaxID=59734 RepID=UPI00056FC2D7|nr:MULTISPECIES: hypothetical protein [Empedobacter]MDM1041778.1 hypothetical protein [Empedobacter brevis]MDM1135708.1 hypothetical protein [Empedobacter sp. R750]